MRNRCWLWVASCVILLLACSEPSAPPTGVCGEQGCSEGCVQLSGDNCDILEEACRQRIFDAVVCVRGTPGEMPEVRTITQEEYVAELLDDGDEDAGVEDAADDAWSTALRLVRLVDADTTSEEASIADRATNVAGYYDSSNGQVTLIDRDRREDSDGAQALLAHELVHALQDQEMGLSELSDRTGRSTDSWLARSCLVEGEATLYEELATSLLRGHSVDPGYWDVNLDWYSKYSRGEVAISPSPYASLWRLAYPVGARFMTDAWLIGGNHGVQSIYWAVPQATIYWMHGHAAFLERQGQLVQPLACNQAAAPDGYERAQSASLGAFAVYAALARVSDRARVPPIGAAWQYALQWRQDSLTVFTNDEGAVAASWRIRFADNAIARAVEIDLSDSSAAASDLQLFARGAEVEILAAEAGGQVLSNWDGTLAEACPVDE
jgi:hypothetical protein